jgi:hypothetical protein
MNINSFTSEVVSAPSARRVSDRKKNIVPLDKSFFKKTYKTKTPPLACGIDNKSNCQIEINTPKPGKVFEKYAHVIFPVLPPKRRQAKAMQNYRTKKLKQMFQTETGLEEAVARHKTFGLNLLLLQHCKRIAPNRKSIYATVRARDAQGRFNNAASLSKPHSSQYSTVDVRDNCHTESQTTIEGSFLSFLSFDSSNEVCTKQNHFDIDCMHEVSRQTPRSLSISMSLPSQTSYCRVTENEKECINEQHPMIEVNYSPATPESNLGESVMQLWDFDSDLLENY